MRTQLEGVKKAAVQLLSLDTLLRLPDVRCSERRTKLELCGTGRCLCDSLHERQSHGCSGCETANVPASGLGVIAYDAGCPGPQHDRESDHVVDPTGCVYDRGGGQNDYPSLGAAPCRPGGRRGHHGN